MAKRNSSEDAFTHSNNERVVFQAQIKEAVKKLAEAQPNKQLHEMSSDELAGVIDYKTKITLLSKLAALETQICTSFDSHVENVVLELVGIHKRSKSVYQVSNNSIIQAQVQEMVPTMLKPLVNDLIASFATDGENTDKIKKQIMKRVDGWTSSYEMTRAIEDGVREKMQAQVEKKLADVLGKITQPTPT